MPALAEISATFISRLQEAYPELASALGQDHRLLGKVFDTAFVSLSGITQWREIKLN
jgi:hypothetical protein